MDIDLVPEKVKIQEVDGPRMEQVFENFLSNAIKFSPKGATISIRSKPDSDNKGIHFIVEDTGPGILKEDLPHVFERFYQGKTPEGRVFVGSGIGLALAKRVIEDHGGTIWAESTFGKGTALHFILSPRKPAKIVH